MPTPKPLTPEQAKRSLAHRFGSRMDRLRQFSTRFGVRPTRVFLVWTKWTGAVRGDGDETILMRVEILPTPRVTDTAALARRPWAGGVMPEGSMRIDRISSQLTHDTLTGRVLPTGSLAGTSTHCAPQLTAGTPVSGTLFNPKVNPQVDFFWELVEDGRGDNPADRLRFRVLGRPYRDAGAIQWSVLLEEASEETDRAGLSKSTEEDTPFDADDT